MGGKTQKQQKVKWGRRGKTTRFTKQISWDSVESFVKKERSNRNLQFIACELCLFFNDNKKWYYLTVCATND